MKKLTTLIFCFISLTFYAQVYISGTVYDIDNTPLEGASVYINNTSVGTTTNDQGEFHLNLPEGIHQVVVSYVGFQSVRYTLNTATYSEPIQFKLIEKENMLDEVVIARREKMTKSERRYFFQRFKNEFIGRSKFAKSCKISNREVLIFDFDNSDRTLDVSASEPLIIVNKNLGYEITYDLIHFELSPLSVTYLGNAKYKELEGSNSKKKRWAKNRLEVFHGSQRHFLQAVLNKKVTEEGYTVDNIKRIPNPERPTFEELKKAKEILRRNNPLQRSSFNTNTVSDSILIKAQETIEKSRLDEFVFDSIKGNLELNEYTIIDSGKPHLRFSNYLKITYANEPVDKNYQRYYLKNQKENIQTSRILLYNETVQIHKLGTLSRPLDVYLEGYWAFEKVGDTLPLDYNPN